ncbi:hypothetical protein Pyn_40366 [Prunus yedoensis var. nudiflora]|uniref:Uncharacterized protein n=1 Tax=Prunus yedoensis var. nudiflora TaxID=2094558 RepID=A0A314YBD0_PRUYE|nr:hypothetical protein Pyn_40366 [Prunus yedoensis var. nudiflora]
MTLYMMVARCRKSKIQTLEEPSPHGLQISECLERKLCNRMQGNFRKEQTQCQAEGYAVGVDVG